MARPPKVPGKADNWQIRLFLRECVAVSTSFFFTLIAPRRLKISRYTRNSILKIVFTMVGRPKMPREVRNGRFLQIAPIWTVTAKLREMASVKIWKNAVFRFGGSPRSFWHTSCSGLFLRESRLPKKCTVRTQGWLTSHTALRQKARNFLEKTKVNSSEILPFFRHQTIQFWMLQHHLMMKEAGISKLTNQSSRSTISLYKLKYNLLAPSKMTNLVQNLI